MLASYNSIHIFSDKPGYYVIAKRPKGPQEEFEFRSLLHRLLVV